MAKRCHSYGALLLLAFAVNACPSKRDPLGGIGPPKVERCGSIGCYRFASPEAAFEFVLAKNPRVLAVGETHALKGMPPVPSTTRRFTDHLLPKLKSKATDLVLELTVASGACGESEVRVAEKQKPVTLGQAPTDQNEFVRLGQAVKALGLRLHVLRPSCEQYRGIARAGEDAMLQMLELIRNLTAARVAELLAVAKGTPPSPPLVVTYGGAMHNDLFPREGRESFSFGPELADKTKGRYVELDLIVREFISNSPAWQALPWYSKFDRTLWADQTLLLAAAPNSWVLVFARSKAPAAAN